MIPASSQPPPPYSRLPTVVGATSTFRSPCSGNFRRVWRGPPEYLQNSFAATQSDEAPQPARRAGAHRIGVQLGQAHSVDRLLPARQGAARVLREGIREGA